MTREPWRPDWRDATAYNWINSVSDEEVAWEFLRRNPAYRKEWLSIKDAENTEAFAHFAPDGDGAPVSAMVSEKTRQTCRKYCLEQLWNPDHSGAQLSQLSWNCIDREKVEPWHDCIFDEDGEVVAAGRFSETDLFTEREVVIKFSLSSEGSIKRQLESAEKLLRRLRKEFSALGRLPKTKEARSAERSTMVKHLRVLDALAAGASQHDIGKAFYEVEDQLGNIQNLAARGGEARKAAEEWRDSKYKLLL
jgi:hypothetical protein